LSTRFNIFGEVMTFINQKKIKIFKGENPTKQLIDDNYTEISGSRGEILTSNVVNKISYKFIYNIQLDYNTGNKWFLHVKLQKSNDNFNSNINDVQGASYNISSNMVAVTDHRYSLSTAFFIIDGLDGTHQLRLVCRAYSNSNKPQLHESDYFDGVADTNVFDTSLIIREV